MMGHEHCNRQIQDLDEKLTRTMRAAVAAHAKVDALAHTLGLEVRLTPQAEGTVLVEYVTAASQIVMPEDRPQ